MLDEFFEQEKHNEKARQNLRKLLKTGTLLDETGKEINLGKTVNYQFRSSSNGQQSKSK